MKTKLALTIFLITNILLSQSFWEKTNFPSDNSSLFSVHSLIENAQGDILAGTFAKGVYRTNDLGESWFESGLTNHWIISLAKTSNGNIYCATVGSQFGSGVYRSTDGGSDWSRVWDSESHGMNCIYVDSEDNIYVGLNFSDGEGGIYKSSDGGANWQNIFNLTENVYAIIRLNNGRILAASYGKVLYSDNNGSSWNTTSTGLVSSTLSGFALNNSDEIFLTTLGYGIYKSEDNGLTWITKKGAGADYSSITISKEDNIYAGSRGYWVYQSLDNGDNWSLINGGMGDSKYVLSLLVSSSGYLFAGMDYNGIYKSVDKVVTSVEFNENNELKYNLIQNYPNPFNPSTKIKYTLPGMVESGMSNVKLVVYDVLGNEVAELVNEPQSAGSYEVTFDATKLSSGVYFYTLNAGTFKQVRKMMLVK